MLTALSTCIVSVRIIPLKMFVETVLIVLVMSRWQRSLLRLALDSGFDLAGGSGVGWPGATAAT